MNGMIYYSSQSAKTLENSLRIPQHSVQNYWYQQNTHICL